MPTIQSLVSAQLQTISDSEFSGDSREQLEQRLETLMRQIRLHDATERTAHIGHYEWSREQDCLESCSEEYANLFGMSIDEVLEAHSSLEKTLQMIHPEDREQYMNSTRDMYDSKALEVEFRILLRDGSIRHVREFAVAVIDDEGIERGSYGLIQDVTERVEREQELMFKDAMASQAETITDIGYFIFDMVNNRHLFVSQGQARIVALGVDEFREKIRSIEDYLSYIHELDRERIRQLYQQPDQDGDGWQVEYRVKRPGGEMRWVREMGKPHKRDGDRVEQIIGVVQDVTEQKKIEQELRYKDALANQAEAITEIGHFVYDEIREQFLYVSPGLARIYGCKEEEITGSDLMQVGGMSRVHPDDREAVGKVYDKFLAEGDEWQVEYRLLRDDGEIRWVREMGKVHLVTHGIPEQTIGVLQDITRQKIAEREVTEARDSLEQQVVERTRELVTTVKQLQLEIKEREKIAAELNFLANHDALTGLPSLRLCKDRLDQSLAEARRKRQTSAVMFLDLDGFKEINDRHGHEFGDRVLKAVAERIVSEIRETDTVARIGGDEFVIILSSLPESAIADRIAASLVERIADPLEIRGIQVGVSASIGISLYPEHGVTSEELIRSADKAMYRIKREGKNDYGLANAS